MLCHCGVREIIRDAQALQCGAFYFVILIEGSCETLTLQVFLASIATYGLNSENGIVSASPPFLKVLKDLVCGFLLVCKGLLGR